MNKFWVFPITQNNLLICLDKGILGARGNNASRLRNMEVGDIIIFYVSRINIKSYSPVREFFSTAKCMGKPFESGVSIWPGYSGDAFPFRIPIEVIDRKRCKIVDIINQLSFIKNKGNWGSAFLGGARLISEEDFFIIKKTMK
jgi:predicted RNA-binding protein